jgi:hypothetical protein
MAVKGDVMRTLLQTKPYELHRDEGQRLRSLGALVVVKATAEQTGGAFNLFDVSCPIDFATPLHIHYAEDVAVFVLEGTLTLFLGDKRIDQSIQVTLSSAHGRIYIGSSTYPVKIVYRSLISREKGRTDMKTHILPHPAIQDSIDRTQAERLDQYTLWQILGIWALVALPMALLIWVVLPIIIPYSPLHPGIIYWLLIIAGMVWQFVVSLVIIYRELGTLRWSAIRQRTWLQTPRDPRTDQPNLRLFWWVLPPLIFNALFGIVLAGYLDAPMVWLFPALQQPQFTEMSQLAVPEFQGQWWLLGIVLVSHIFNYFLGEEFLWHGVLLPKMQGVFGKYDWVANAVLFGFYHLHKPWALPSVIVTNLAYSWPARRFRSNWMAIVVHGIEGLPGLVLTLALILGWIG